MTFAHTAVMLLMYFYACVGLRVTVIKLLFTTLADQGPISEKHDINNKMAVIS